MCFVTAWSGKLPTGLLSNLLTAMQCRGRDGTGIAFRDFTGAKPQTVSYRQAYSAAAFVKMHQPELKRARQSPIGLAHARRASSGMVIDPHNAHPFVCGKTFFIHNGFVRNWKTIDPTVTNDSIVIGPALEEFSKQEPVGDLLDMTKFRGIMAVAWMRRDVVRCFKINQDLAAVNILWIDADGKTHPLCLVCSKKEAVEEAIQKIDCEYQVVELAEGTVYRITDNGPEVDATLKVDSSCYEEDAVGSQTKLTLKLDPC